MKIKHLLAVSIILIVSIAAGFTGCGSTLDGSLPQFTIGDKWVSRWLTGGEEYIVTSLITGEEALDGKNCWVMETTFEPAYLGIVVSTTNKYLKTDLNIVSIDYHTNTDEFTSIAYEITSTPFYPLTVGKESMDNETRTITTGNSTVTQQQTVNVITRTIVEKIEKIEVEAGTFNCFKLLKYDDSGNLIQITWRSDKTKLFQVKMTDPDAPDDIYELISYSVD